MVWNLLALAAIRGLFKAGLAPQGMVIRRALIAIKKDNLSEAVDIYTKLARKDYSSEKVRILHEILVSELNYRKKILTERIQTLEENQTPATPSNPSQIKAALQATKILDGFLNRLGIGMRASENPPEKS
jgi:hypothetical protein